MSEDEQEERRAPRGRQSALDQQKAHLQKLMANPEKPVPIPEAPNEWKPKDPSEFVRFYMGSSAGAGSEVYHVYRHLRRRETVRQQWIQDQAEKEEQEREFQEKLAANKAAAEERTAKKRAKRLKRKHRQKEKRKVGKTSEVSAERSHSEEEEEEDEGEKHFVIGGR